eukprot:9488717-Pyramimonas_sp.AAC.2
MEHTQMSVRAWLAERREERRGHFGRRRGGGGIRRRWRDYSERGVGAGPRAASGGGQCAQPAECPRRN